MYSYVASCIAHPSFCLGDFLVTMSSQRFRRRTVKDAGLPKDAHHNSVQMNPDFLVTSKKLETLIFSYPRIACSDSSFGKVRSLSTWHASYLLGVTRPWECLKTFFHLTFHLPQTIIVWSFFWLQDPGLWTNHLVSNWKPIVAATRHLASNMIPTGLEWPPVLSWGDKKKHLKRLASDSVVEHFNGLHIFPNQQNQVFPEAGVWNFPTIYEEFSSFNKHMYPPWN